MFKRRKLAIDRPAKPQAPALTLAQSWWLFAAAIAALVPLLQHIPLWLSISAGVGMAWRAWLIWRNGRLPPRWLLFVLVIAACAAVVYSYRSLFGRDPGLALLVIFLSLKLLELRSVRDGMTVIMLGFFLLLAGFFFNQSIPATLLAAAALLVIVAALIAMQAGPRRSVSDQLRQSAWLLAQALPFMLICFVLFPRVEGPLWGMPRDAFGATSGLTDQIAPGSISQVAQSDAIAFRVRFEGTGNAVPPPQQQYWRTLTLTQYDGVNWRHRPTLESDELPYVPDGKSLDYVITLEPNNQRWLPVLETVGRLPPDSRIDRHGVVLANTPVRSRLRYAMRAYPDFRPPPQESSKRLAAALSLPDDPNLNPRTRAVAAAWRRDYKSDAAILRAAVAFFQNQLLSYTLNPPLMRQNAVDAFLFDYKRGFCEHFASAFAFALRAAGVPARVIGGYQGGEVNPVDGYLTVHQYDAHVWVEAWIEGRGWVRADPTADSAPSRIEGGLRTAVTAAEIPLFERDNYAWLRALRYRLDAVANAWNQAVLGFNSQRQRDVLHRLGMSDPDWRKMTLWLGALCGLLMVALVAYAVRERARVDPVQNLWLRFQRHLARHGVTVSPWLGPEAMARQAAAQMPQHAAAIHAIAERYIALRYAHPTSSQTKGDQMAALRDLIARLRP